MSLVGKRDRVSNYYAVKNGKVVKSLGKEEPAVMEGVTERVNKNGVKVYEILNDYIAGRIIELGIQPPPEEHPDYKEQMLITMQGEEGVKVIIRVPFDSAYGRGFLLASEGIDWNEPVELEPYSYTDKAGKSKTGLSVIQHGQQLPWTMGTKENPGDVPKLKKVKFKGKDTWDNSEQLAWFKEYYNTLALNLMPVDADEPEVLDEDGVPF